MTYLDAIVDHHRSRSRSDNRLIDNLIEKSLDTEHPRDFAAQLKTCGSNTPAVIAEIKKASPSLGSFAPAELRDDIFRWAQIYEHAGAACISVLTDEAHFEGSRDDLAVTKSAVSIPTLRKDFTVSENDICDARIMGADAVLLIAAVLDQHQLTSFVELAGELSLTPIVEVHDIAESEKAQEAKAPVIGVNQRDLHTFEVDTQRAKHVAERLPKHILTIAESGISKPQQLSELGDAGFIAALIGESIITASDPAAMIKSFVNLS